MPIIRILWDDLVESRLAKVPYNDGHLTLSCLKDIDSRISDLEEQHSNIEDKLDKLIKLIEPVVPLFNQEDKEGRHLVQKHPERMERSTVPRNQPGKAFTPKEELK